MCVCGHYEYDHKVDTRLCDVSYCECELFVAEDKDAVAENKEADNNPWGPDGTSHEPE